MEFFSDYGGLYSLLKQQNQFTPISKDNATIRQVKRGVYQVGHDFIRTYIQ